MATIFGKAGGSETIVGTAANDIIYPNTGFDLVDGGAGIDTVILQLNRSKADLSAANGLFYIDTVSGASGNASQTRMKNVERLEFNDAKIAIDMGATQHGGETALLIGVVVGKGTVTLNKPLIGAVLDIFDQGASMKDISGAVMRLHAWNVIIPGIGPDPASNTQIANYLLTNANGRAPDAATLAAGVAALDGETAATEGTFLAGLAVSAQNQVTVNLIGFAQTGLTYTT